jgi:hypothetical protein
MERGQKHHCEDREEEKQKERRIEKDQISQIEIFLQLLP